MAAIEAAQAAAAEPAASPPAAAMDARAPTALVGAEDADAEPAAADAAAADAAAVEQPAEPEPDVEQPAEPEEGPAIAMRGGVRTSLAGVGYIGVKEHEMQLERDIDRRLAAMGVAVKPLQQMQQPALRPGAMPYGSAMMAPGGAPPQGLWVGAGPAFLPPDGDYPGGSTGIPAERLCA